MMPPDKNGAWLGTEAPEGIGEDPKCGNHYSLDQNSRQTLLKSKTPSKTERVLAAFLTGRKFHRFQAERELHDHCLHSTVATLEGKGVKIRRRFIKVPGYQGIATDVKEYWVDPEDMAFARSLLPDRE